MIKPRIYLDTTVPSAYFDDRTADRMRLTREFWKTCPDRYILVVSDVVLAEIEASRNETRRNQLFNLVADLDVLQVNQEAQTLAQEYVSRGIFPARYRADGLHVSIAIVNGVEYLASWNFSHLVKVNTRREINLVNALKGYGQIEIVAPPEL